MGIYQLLGLTLKRWLTPKSRWTPGENVILLLFSKKQCLKTWTNRSTKYIGHHCIWKLQKTNPSAYTRHSQYAHTKCSNNKKKLDICLICRSHFFNLGISVLLYLVISIGAQRCHLKKTSLPANVITQGLGNITK